MKVILKGGKIMGFKKDFYWGGSVSSFQTEGAWDEGGKGLSIYDVRPTNPEFSDSCYQARTRAVLYHILQQNHAYCHTM